VEVTLLERSHRGALPVFLRQTWTVCVPLTTIEPKLRVEMGVEQSMAKTEYWGETMVTVAFWFTW